MSGRVPLARRNLFADRRRLAASVTGVGLAVMLILLLDGMWAGIRQHGRDRVGVGRDPDTLVCYVAEQRVEVGAVGAVLDRVDPDDDAVEAEQLVADLVHVVVVVDDCLGFGSQLGEAVEERSEGSFGAGRHRRPPAVAAEQQPDADSSAIPRRAGHVPGPSGGVSAMGRRGCWRWRTPS